MDYSNENDPYEFHQNETVTPNVLSLNVEESCQEYDRLGRGLAGLRQKINQILLTFAELVRLQGGAVIREHNVFIPTELEGHRFKRLFFRPAEFACFIAGLILLIFLMAVSVDLSYLQIGVVGLIAAAIFALAFPGALVALADVGPNKPESVRKVYFLLAFGVVLTVAGLIGFYLSRGAEDVTGWLPDLYLLSGSIAELGFALMAACFRVLSRYYAWSIDLSSKYQKYFDEFIELSQQQARALSEAVASYASLMQFKDFPPPRISLQMMEKLKGAYRQLSNAQDLGVEPRVPGMRPALSEGGQ